MKDFTTLCSLNPHALGGDINHTSSALSDQVLYKQNWEDTKDKYLLPPDAPELVQAVKNTAMFSKVRASALS